MQATEFYEGVYVVIGPPGTGKTTFLAKQVQAVLSRYAGFFGATIHPTPVMICSLTRAAAAEVAGRDTGLSKRMIGTLHAHCFRALGSPSILTADHIEAWNRDHPWRMESSDYASTSSGNDEAMDFSVEPRTAASGDKLLAELDLLRHRMQTSMSREMREFSAAWSSFKRDVNAFDFTDLIEGAYEMIDEAPGTPAVIMVDEAQDLSLLEYSLIRKWSQRARATIIVGDPWQSLYVWRGANPDLFFDKSVPESHRRVLSQSYRVPAKIVHVARTWMERHLSSFIPIEYSPRTTRKFDDESTEGIVETCVSSIHDVDEAVAKTEELIETGRTVMFQSSCGYMLTNLLAVLRSRSIPFSNPWRRFHGGWNPLNPSKGVSVAHRLFAFVKQCHDVDPAIRRPWTALDVHNWMSPMRVNGQLARGAKSSIEAMSHRVDENGRKTPLQEVAIEEVDLDDLFVGEARDFVLGVWRGQIGYSQAAGWWRESLLGAPKKSAGFPVGVVQRLGAGAILDEPKVYVGTIHSFKGAEADAVFVFPDLSAAGYREWGDKNCADGTSPSRDSVARLMYVAMTRARDQLIICKPASSLCAPLRGEVLSALQSYSSRQQREAYA